MVARMNTLPNTFNNLDGLNKNLIPFINPFFKNPNILPTIPRPPPPPDSSAAGAAPPSTVICEGEVSNAASLASCSLK